MSGKIVCLYISFREFSRVSCLFLKTEFFKALKVLSSSPTPSFALLMVWLDLSDIQAIYDLLKYEIFNLFYVDKFPVL